MQKKLSQDELIELIQSRQDLGTVIHNIGMITIELTDISGKLSSLQKEREDTLSTYKIVSDKFNSLTDTLTSKYGPGNINLETGEIS